MGTGKIGSRKANGPESRDQRLPVLQNLPLSDISTNLKLYNKRNKRSNISNWLLQTNLPTRNRSAM